MTDYRPKTLFHLMTFSATFNVKVGKRMFLFGLLVSLPLVSGCFGQPKPPGEEYLARLARVLDTTPSDVRILPVARPSKTSLSLPIPQQSIDLLDMLSITGCALANTLGEKNSSLGKLSLPSQQMRLESEFLLKAPDCIRSLQADKPLLAQRLQAAWQSKYDARLAIWWNAWVSGDEWQAFASASARPLAMFREPSGNMKGAEHQSRTLSALEQALEQGQRWQQGDVSHQSAHVESVLKTLLDGESLGRWQTSQARQTELLLQATRMMDDRLDQRPPCPVGRRTPLAERTFNVIQKFYIGELQPYMTTSDKFGRALLEKLRQIAEVQPPPEAYRDWLDQLTDSRTRFQQASKLHVASLSRFMQSCGLQPGEQAGP